MQVDLLLWFNSIESVWNWTDFDIDNIVERGLFADAL